MRYWVVIFTLWAWCGQAQISTTTFEEVERLMKDEKRPVLIFLYTDWCSYCELMKRKTFTDSQVIQQINANYYLIFFNGESKKKILWGGQEWKFKKRGLRSGTHQLAEYFAENQGEVTYPSLVFLDDQFHKVYQHKSYLKAPELRALLKVIR